MTIRVADGLDIPLEQTPQPIALIGRRGSGKTYAAGKLVEEFLDAGYQVVVLDPVGTWWALRLQADGVTPAYMVPVLGGSHGDIPLEATAGKLVATLVTERRTSMVLDVSEFNGAEQRRFVGAFMAELLAQKKKHKSAVMVVMEEAQEFAPQMARSDTATMLGAVERVVKLGRNFGIVPVLITQRPQSVNKDVLNQTELLFTFQLTGPQERKAVELWVQEKGADRSIVGELPGLPIGTALVWSPQWLNVFGRFAILPKRTYDASATPGAAPVEAAPLGAIDLEEVRAAMAATIEKAEADNPAALRKRLAVVERERNEARASESHWREIAERATDVGERAADAAVEATLLWHGETTQKLDSLLAGIQEASGKLGDMAADLVMLRSQMAAIRPERVPAPVLAAPAVVERRPRRVATEPVDGPLKAGERRILETLARHHPMRVTKAQLGTLAKFKITGGTFTTYWGHLRRLGLVEDDGGLIGLTPEGFDAVGAAPSAPASTEELLETWRTALKAGARRMLDELVEMYPVAIKRSELADLVEMTASGGTFSTYLGTLRRNGLVEMEGDLVRASSTLFLGVGR